MAHFIGYYCNVTSYGAIEIPRHSTIMIYQIKFSARNAARVDVFTRVSSDYCTSVVAAAVALDSAT